MLVVVVHRPDGLDKGRTDELAKSGLRPPSYTRGCVRVCVV